MHPLDSVGGPMVTISGGQNFMGSQAPSYRLDTTCSYHRSPQRISKRSINLLGLSVELCTFWEAPSRVPSVNKESNSNHRISHIRFPKGPKGCITQKKIKNTCNVINRDFRIWRDGEGCLEVQSVTLQISGSPKFCVFKCAHRRQNMQH